MNGDAYTLPSSSWLIRLWQHTNILRHTHTHQEQEWERERVEKRKRLRVKEQSEWIKREKTLQQQASKYTKLWTKGGQGTESAPRDRQPQKRKNYSFFLFGIGFFFLLFCVYVGCFFLCSTFCMEFVCVHIVFFFKFSYIFIIKRRSIKIFRRTNDHAACIKWTNECEISNIHNITTIPCKYTMQCNILGRLNVMSSSSCNILFSQRSCCEKPRKKHTHTNLPQPQSQSSLSRMTSILVLTIVWPSVTSLTNY